MLLSLPLLVDDDADDGIKALALSEEGNEEEEGVSTCKSWESSTALIKRL